MSALQNPSNLNPLRQFKQATAILKKTSRASNPAWYASALDLPQQLHIRSDGASVSVYLFERGDEKWTETPPITEAQLLDPTFITEYVTEAAKQVRSNGAASLGVILHIADEFALTEIKPEFKDREKLTELRAAAINDPASILADSINTAEFSWRLLPYPANHSESIATAVTLSQKYAPILDAIRKVGETADFPIITHALSAPLTAILAIPDAKLTPNRPSVTVLQYPFFTVLAFFNEASDLLLIRTQLHRGLRRPPNFRQAIATTSASLELSEPDIFVFPLGKDVDAALVEDLTITFNNSRVQLIVPNRTGSLPAHCAECAISVREEIDDMAPGSTFAGLKNEGWALQDFSPAGKNSAEIYPTRAEMKLLRLSRLAVLAVAAIAVLASAWHIYGIFKIVRTPEWSFQDSESSAINMRFTMLNMERNSIEQWNSLLADRSKSWTSMELTARLFPENSGTLLRTFTYSARPDTAPGTTKAGFTKEWKITGVAKEQSLEMVNSLTRRENIAAHFNEIALLTGDESFRTDIATRSIVVNVRTQENNAYGSSASVEGRPADPGANFPFSFDLIITQRFEATDPLAVPIAKAP